LSDDLEGRMMAASQLLFLELRSLAEQYRLNGRETLALLAMTEAVWIKDAGITLPDYTRLNRMRQAKAEKDLP
jgi:hypothetical protein